ncbi:hypothetical protein THASP1DRAFT_32334 [Thamnocephalis sphaerospora]|uniref:DH domain-containing protein n=1 Tax=Thamnocephalis sphaerospora TaxID=78915 RepID=A0A4P9XJA9_9FUNG|nr:hypothetical protein THASP1DRAFT_32334 [Thamnocephalis sphaerospora]|eukprot:RKP05832.1 hypothetical protein THASP1DRAFT_32334 [Thamnocephalis sphaerospora]
MTLLDAAGWPADGQHSAITHQAARTVRARASHQNLDKYQFQHARTDSGASMGAGPMRAPASGKSGDSSPSMIQRQLARNSTRSSLAARAQALGMLQMALVCESDEDAAAATAAAAATSPGPVSARSVSDMPPQLPPLTFGNASTTTQSVTVVAASEASLAEKPPVARPVARRPLPPAPGPPPTLPAKSTTRATHMRASTSQMTVQIKAPPQVARAVGASSRRVQSQGPITTQQLGQVDRASTIPRPFMDARLPTLDLSTMAQPELQAMVEHEVHETFMALRNATSQAELRAHTPPPSHKPPAPPSRMSTQTIRRLNGAVVTAQDKDTAVGRNASCISIGTSPSAELLNRLSNYDALRRSTQPALQSEPCLPSSALSKSTRSFASLASIVAAGSSDTLSRNTTLNDERRRTLANLLRIQTQAEALYVRRLETLHERFYEPLKRRYANVRRWITLGIGGSGSRAERTVLLERIFSPVGPLLEFHRDFLGKLRTLERLALASSVRAVVGLFQKRMQGFETDIEYLRQYPTAIATFENLCFRDSRFRKTVKACEIDAGHLNVRAFLGTPKEQLRRYAHFLERIIELCPADSFDRTEARGCLTQMEQLLDRVEHLIKQADDITDAAIVHAEVAHLPDAVLSPGQRLIYKGPLHYRQSRTDHVEYPVQCYLLRDRLILATDDNLNGHAAGPGVGHCYTHRRTILLAEARLEPFHSDPVTQENLIRIGTLQGYHYLNASDYASYCSWSKMIHQVKELLPVEARVVHHQPGRDRRNSVFPKRAMESFSNPRLSGVRRAVGIPA